ncbi:hypothetical protein K502DRAFT_315205 [Neoconidiobolus thromboides FSU 785]|nr:hypothetical protein K502DRAFT_315205 [Neoconidiobolus thromboides FSU 785]
MSYYNPNNPQQPETYYYDADTTVDPYYQYYYSQGGENTSAYVEPTVTAIPLGYDQGSYQPPENKKESKQRKKKTLRTAAGKVWEDRTLLEWDPSDFRLFVGDLGNEVNDEMLKKAFERYPSFVKAKVIKDKRNDKTKGYGFVSFKDSDDFIKASKEMNGKYVGTRPIKLRKSTWKERALQTNDKKKSNRPY